MKPLNANISSIGSVTGVRDSVRPATGQRPGAKGDSSFRDKLSALQSTSIEKAKSALTSGLKFSNHAIDRMHARGVRFSPDEMSRIEGAVHKAAAKGAKNTLLLTDNSALIVSVKDKTVVTVMDKAALKDNVFTNIDSTVMI